MKRMLVGLALLLSTAAGAETRQTFNVDLNNDGVAEQVLLTTYVVDGVNLGQLQVKRGTTTLWSGPRSKATYSQDPLVFLGEFDRGDIEFVGDYDHDGRVDLVATQQKSDVSPTVFRIFHWDGKSFAFDRRAVLVPQGSAFVWKDVNPALEAWVDELHSSGKGRQIEAKLMDIRARKTTSLRLRWKPGSGFVKI